LRIENNVLLEALEEALDLSQYLMQMWLERENEVIKGSSYG